MTSAQKNSIPFQYANDVLSGKIITGKYVRLAVERFFRWIDESPDSGYTLNHTYGMHIIDFFEQFLVHTKGKKAGQPFVLSPFQQFTLYNVFGWLDKNGNRRINEVYEKIGKKNGKTAVMAGLGLYGLAFDNEPEAEIYVGATKEEQARICIRQAQSFVDKTRLSGLFTTYQKGIKLDGSFMVPLGGDSKTQDGMNAHIGIIDEYHAHKDDGVKENIESSMASRRQPLLYHITTAGFNPYGVCANYENMCKDVLEGKLHNDHLFVMIHDLDKDGDWEDPKNWAKANPNLGESVSMEFLMKEYKKAKNQTSKIPNFKTKHLNMWVDAPSVWIEDEVWMKGSAPVKVENFKKYGCYAGLDLSSTTDITAFVLVSEPDEEGIRDVLPFFFIPKATIDRRSKEDGVPYRDWMNNNLIIATEGNTVDYNKVVAVVNEQVQMHGVIRVELDKWNASGVSQKFEDLNINHSYFSQAISVINGPTKEFERLVYDGKLRHGGNPVLRWMLSGAVIVQDPNENIKVHKGKSNAGRKRVDGIIATIMALGGSMSEQDDSNESAYNDPNTEIYF